MPMATKCINCPLRSKDMFVDMAESELSFVQRFKVGELNIERGTPLLMEGSSSPQLFTVLSGLGLRYKTLENGRRQVINFVFPGDFIGLQAGVMGHMEHSVEASTQMTLCVFDRSELWSVFRNHPNRAFDMTWLAATEEHFLGEALASIGQLSALGRMSWAILRLYYRFEALDMIKRGSFPLPYRQQDLADTLGLSLVHTNKTLARLRDRQLANWSEGQMTVHSLEGLEQISELSGGSTNRPRPLI